MCDNGYVAVLLNIGASYAFFVPEVYSPCRYDIVTRAPHYFAIESVRSNSLIHVYPFALNHLVMGLRLSCIAKFGGKLPILKPINRVWLNFTLGLLLNFVTFIVIIIIFKCYKYIIDTRSCLVCKTCYLYIPKSAVAPLLKWNNTPIRPNKAKAVYPTAITTNITRWLNFLFFITFIL